MREICLCPIGRGFPQRAPRCRHGRRQPARIRPDGPSEMARILDALRSWHRRSCGRHAPYPTLGPAAACTTTCARHDRSCRRAAATPARRRSAGASKGSASRLVRSDGLGAPIPEGYDGHWEIGGQVVVSHVYLTQEHRQACADEAAGGKAIELLVRVAFEEPGSSRPARTSER